MKPIQSNPIIQSSQPFKSQSTVFDALKAFTGALALISQASPVTARRLDSAQTLAAPQVMRLANSSIYCEYLDQNGARQDISPLLETGCQTEFQPLQQSPEGIPFTRRFTLIDGSVIHCSNPDSFEKNRQLNSELHCVENEIETGIQEEEAQAKRAAFERPFLLSSILPVAVNCIVAAAASSSRLVDQPHGVNLPIKAAAFTAISSSTFVASHLAGWGLLQLINFDLSDTPDYKFVKESHRNLWAGMLAIPAVAAMLSYAAARCLPDRPVAMARVSGLVNLAMIAGQYFGAYQAQNLIQGHKPGGQEGNFAPQLGIIPLGVLLTFLYVVERLAPAPQHGNLRGAVGQRPANVLATGVHALNNNSIAYARLAALQALDTELQQQAPETTEATLTCIRDALMLVSEEDQIGASIESTQHQVKSKARKFIATLNRDHGVFNAEFGRLKLSPSDALAMVWRASMAHARTADQHVQIQVSPLDIESGLESKVEEIQHEEKKPEVGQLNSHVTKMQTQFFEQMAHIVTTVHGGDNTTTNPCGSGKIASLLQYASTYLTQLDLFQHKLIALPVNPVVANEYFADFNRMIDILYNEMSPAIPTGEQEKEHLKNIYVTQQDKMTSEVFEGLYCIYLGQLEATV